MQILWCLDALGMRFNLKSGKVVINESHTPACCKDDPSIYVPYTSSDWRHGLPGGIGRRVDEGAQISHNLQVQIGSMGVEKKFTARSRIGI